MQTIQITISGEDLSDLVIRKLPPGSKQREKDTALKALHNAIQRNEVKESGESKKNHARQGNPV